MRKKTVVCDKIRYAEFPDLKSGSYGESDNYVDMTQYLIDKGLEESHSVHEFQKKFFMPIINAQQSYGIDSENVIVINEADGHTLLADELSLLFIMYTDPDFIGYTLDRMDDLLTKGAALSDSAILQLASNRFPDLGICLN